MAQALASVQGLQEGFDQVLVAASNISEDVVTLEPIYENAVIQFELFLNRSFSVPLNDTFEVTAASLLNLTGTLTSDVDALGPTAEALHGTIVDLAETLRTSDSSLGLLVARVEEAMQSVETSENVAVTAEEFLRTTLASSFDNSSAVLTSVESSLRSINLQRGEIQVISV